jgi:5-methyltetrahydropteroyltriglutamate--homocysteine methyltransferase
MRLLGTTPLTAFEGALRETDHHAHSLALLELDAKQPARAVDITTRAIAALTGKPDRDDTRLARLELDRADALWEIPARKGEAAAAYAAIIERYPNEKQTVLAARSMTALALLEQGKPAEAFATAERADAILFSAMGWPEIRKPDGTEELAPPAIRVIDKVRHVKDIQLADFQYLKSRVEALGKPGGPALLPKVTIPSPTMLHFRGGRAGISRQAYPELDPVFYDDVADAYGEELKSLADAGCTYVQMDDTNLAYLCDEKMREAARQRGDDPNELPYRYAEFINKVVARKPAGMTLAMHLCRGNFKSTHAAAGNYEPVAEALLSKMNLDAFFLEYDDDRSGDFRPLRFLSKGKIVVLGLVTTKFGQLESKDSLKRRIEEAAQYAPLDQLCLSPQCGFSSTVHGNNIAVEDQRRKLQLVVETAQEVWG